MSQKKMILAHLKEHGSLTGLQALRHPQIQSMRLAARIYDLRCAGHKIETQRWRTNSGKTVARYWLRN